MANKKNNTLDKIRIPFGYTLVPERKTERLNLLLGPTLKEELKKTADKEEVSVNELVNNILLDYFEERRKE